MRLIFKNYFLAPVQRDKSLGVQTSCRVKSWDPPVGQLHDLVLLDSVLAEETEHRRVSPGT